MSERTIATELDFLFILIYVDSRSFLRVPSLQYMQHLEVQRPAIDPDVNT